MLAKHAPRGTDATSLGLRVSSRTVSISIVAASLAPRCLILRGWCRHVTQQSRFLLVIEFRVEALKGRLDPRERVARRIYRLLHSLHLSGRLRWDANDDPRAPYKVYEGDEVKGSYPTRAEARRAQQRLAEAEPQQNFIIRDVLGDVVS